MNEGTISTNDHDQELYSSPSYGGCLRAAAMFFLTTLLFEQMVTAGKWMFQMA